MFTGFEKIVEERIKKAQSRGDFNNLPGSGQPLVFEENSLVPDELRLAYKILKNADCLPPEIEIKKEIRQTESLLAAETDVTKKHAILKRLNFLVMKLNNARSGAIPFEAPQKYMDKLTDRMKS